ncbi:MAG: ASKHA domain-containing protein [Geminicoccaceae bacterium]
MDRSVNDPLVVFMPSGRRGRFPVGTPVLQAARSLGVDIDSVCGGRAICGRCQIRIAEGQFAKHGITSSSSHLEQLTRSETRYAGRKHLDSDRRLSCQARLVKDVVIDVPAESQVHKQVVRKRAEARAIEIDPVLRPYYIEVEEPDMYHARGDLERVEEALRNQWNLGGVSIDLKTLRALQAKLRKGDWKITVMVHDDHRIIATRPGFHDKVYGVAVDVGSTTIAAHLCDLLSGEVLASSGMMNPQIRFGEDLMSRVSYVMMNPGGDAEMTLVVRETLTALIGQLAVEAMIDPNDIFEMVFVGNPVMHHLLLGINPVELGGAPFALATDGAMELWSGEIGMTAVNDSARVYILPCIAGHVGADCSGVILSETPHLRDEMTLVVDVGTNAEIVLGNHNGLVACSSPTGPAFEGAQLSSGQRAAPGAIERVRIDRATFEPRFRIIGHDLWSDHEAFGQVARSTGVTGICGSGIIEVIGEMYLCGLINQDGVIDGRMMERTDRIVADGRTFSYVLHRGEPEIRITQNDVRAIQLAKAALYAGCRLLMDRLNVDQVDRIMLAGAFGSHIDPLYAVLLGLIPDCPLDRVHAAGNAAGTGARIALLNKAQRRQIETVVRTIQKVETAVEPRFQEHFVAAMAIPHKTAPTPHLAAAVDLPAKKPASATEESRRRRRRN